MARKSSRRSKVNMWERAVGSEFEVHVVAVSRPPAAPVVTLAAEMTGTEFIDNSAPEGNVEYAVRAFKGTQVSDFLGKSVFVDWAPAVPNTVGNVQENGNVVLTWTAVETATHYEVRRRTIGGEWVTLSDHCNATTFTDTTAPDGTYEYAVRACEGTLMSGFHTVEAVVERAPAAPVVALTVLQASAQVQVSWNAVDGATHYSVQRRTLGGEWVILAEGYGSTQFIDSTAPEGNVEYSVIAYKGTKMSTPSTQGVFLDWPPATPITAAAAQPNGHVNLSWDAVPSATSYDIMRRELGTGQWVVLTDGWSGTEFVDRTAPEGLMQYAVIANEGSQSSGYVAVTVDVNYPPAAPVFNATVQSDKSVVVTWNSVTSATGYDVLRIVNGTMEIVADNVTGNQFIDTTAPVGTVQYAVRAYKGVAVSDYNVATVQISDAPLFTLTANSDGTVTISWDAVAGATEYGVYRSVAGTDDWDYDIYTTGTSVTDTTVTPGQYDYAVIAFSDLEESDYNVETITVAAASSLTAMANDDGTVTLNWTAIDTATKYTILRKMENGSYGTIATNVTSLTFADTDVEAGNYIYAVRGIKGMSTVGTLESEVVTVSEPVMFVAPLPPFGAPTVNAELQEDGSVLVEWNEVADVTRYSVWMREAGGSWGIVTANAPGTSHLVENPPTGVVQFTVKAHNGSVASGFTPFSVNIPGIAPLNVLPPFGAPTVVATYNAETGNVELTWNEVADATRYSVWIREAGGSWVNLTANAGGTTHIVTNPPTGTVQFTAKAHGAAGASSFVAVSVVIPDMLDEIFGDYDPAEELLEV